MHDVIIVGSSPNALAAAARLLAAKKRVLVLEPSDHLGGPVSSHEFHPGFWADTALSSAPLHPMIEQELGLSIAVLPRRTVTVIGKAHNASEVSVGRFQKAVLPAAFRNGTALLQALHASPVGDLPNMTGSEAEALSMIGAQLLGLGEREMMEVLRLGFMSARELSLELNLPFADRVALSIGSVYGLNEGPFARTNVWNYLVHEALNDGLSGPQVVGGLGRITALLADKVRSLGGEIEMGLGPLAVDVDAGSAWGVSAGDRTVEAKRIASDLDVQRTFGQLIPPYHLEPECLRRVRQVRYRGNVARVFIALRKQPEFAGVGEEDLLGTLVIANDVESIERAWDEAKRGNLPADPPIFVTLPSRGDPSRAPTGAHVLAVTVLYVPSGWTDRSRVKEAVLRLLGEHAPGIEQWVDHVEVNLPVDLEERFSLTGGQLYGGETNLSQSFFLRSMPGCRGGCTPIENLYLCGSTGHPPGYSGMSGWLSAGNLLATA
ncbi:MAG: NAD(P)/FAD-dependent oxidoreductase [Polyangiaceae bacterium]|nr:NAD(P)/FAD-dependent oxidoreductase [Polyangiaceae bacterium]